MLVIPAKYSVSSIVGKMKANFSRQLRLRYLELKRTYWGADSGLWGLVFNRWVDEAVIRPEVDHIKNRLKNGTCSSSVNVKGHAA